MEAFNDVKARNFDERPHLACFKRKMVKEQFREADVAKKMLVFMMFEMSENVTS